MRAGASTGARVCGHPSATTAQSRREMRPPIASDPKQGALWRTAPGERPRARSIRSDAVFTEPGLTDAGDVTIIVT